MKVAIVGGSGLVGRALTRSLVADAHDVLVLSRDARRHAAALPAPARIADWSSRDVSGLAASLGGADAVVHLAGARFAPWPWTHRRKAVITSSRVDAVRTIVEALGGLPADRRPRVLVVVSGIDAYPELDDSPDPIPFTESSPMGDGFLAGVSRALETEGRKAEPLGVRVVALRMGHVLARDAELVRILALPVRLFLGGRLGSGRQWVSWIHIDDAVALFRLAMTDRGQVGVLNLTSPGACRQIAFVRSMARVLHRPAVLPVPAWLVRLALGEEATLILGSRRIAPAGALQAGYVFRHPTVDGALDDVLG